MQKSINIWESISYLVNKTTDMDALLRENIKVKHLVTLFLFFVITLHVFTSTLFFLLLHKSITYSYKPIFFFKKSLFLLWINLVFSKSLSSSFRHCKYSLCRVLTKNLHIPGKVRKVFGLQLLLQMSEIVRFFYSA